MINKHRGNEMNVIIEKTKTGANWAVKKCHGGYQQPPLLLTDTKEDAIAWAEKKGYEIKRIGRKGSISQVDAIRVGKTVTGRCTGMSNTKEIERATNTKEKNETI